MHLPLDTVFSVCPHDCPSACALEVERIKPAPGEPGGDRIGRIRGAAAQGYTDGVVRAAQRHGSEAVWPHYYSGTMGLVQRDGLQRLRHAMRYSRQHSTICSALTDAGWLVGHGIKRGVDGREMAESDLIVVWGGNPVSTQVNVMTHIAKARKQRGAKLVVVDVYRTPSI